MRTKIYYLLMLALFISAFTMAQFSPRPPGNCLKTYSDATLQSCEALKIGHILPGTTMSNYTIEFWMNPDILLQYGPNFGDENDQSTLRFRFNSTSKFTLWQGGTKWEVSDASIKEAINQQWAHVAITFKDLGANYEANLYINGVNKGTTFTLPALTDGFSVFKLGTTIEAGTNRYNRRFEGRIDEFRLWTTARTQTEIQNSMSTELLGNETGLLIYYNFNDDVGTSVINKVTPGTYDGTIENITSETHFVESDAFTQAGVLTTDFTASPLAGTSPHLVTFTDASTGEPTNWEWSFPGGTPATSNAQNPQVTYNTPGTYPATLRTYNATYEHEVTKENQVWVNGYDAGKALALDGVDDYMIIPDIFADTERLSAYTVEFWMYQKTFGANQTAQIRGGTQYGSFNFGVKNDGVIHAGFSEENDPTNPPPVEGEVTDSACYMMTDPACFEINKWHHYAVTFGNSIMKLYKNGEIIYKDTTMAIDGPSWNDSIAYHKPGGIHIGSPSGGDKGIFGYIDEFRIWSVERSHEDIINSLQSNVAANTLGLEVYYTFEDGDISQDTLLANKAKASMYIGRLRNFTLGSEFSPSGAFSLDPATIPSVPTNIQTNKQSEFPARVYVKNRIVNIELKESGTHNICIYNISGQAVKRIQSRSQTLTTELPVRGIYIVVITSEDNSKYSTKIVY
jgi:PKD repeat protein